MSTSSETTQQTPGNFSDCPDLENARRMIAQALERFFADPELQGKLGNIVVEVAQDDGEYVVLFRDAQNRRVKIRSGYGKKPGSDAIRIDKNWFDYVDEPAPGNWFIKDECKKTIVSEFFKVYGHLASNGYHT